MGGFARLRASCLLCPACVSCRWVVHRCHELVERVTAGLEKYDMSEAGFLIYQFLWDEYADW